MRRWKRERTPAAADINLSHDVSQYNIILCAHVKQDKGVVYFECLPPPCSPRLSRCQRDGTFMRCWTPCIYPVCQQRSCSSPHCKFHVLETINFKPCILRANQEIPDKKTASFKAQRRGEKKISIPSNLEKRKKESCSFFNFYSHLSRNCCISNLSSF